MLNELDTVRVVRLNTDDRHFTGSPGVLRSPRIGDTGAIVHAYDPTDISAPFIVECVASDGLTVWLADFSTDELELEIRYRPQG
jgi:hypothetical protein